MGDTDAGGLFRFQEGIGAHGAHVPGPPWILGLRGAPREAPENTLAGLRRAIDLGLDGVAYELRACYSGELVLLADALLERTTDLSGPLSEKTMPEIAAADAGGWFAKAFSGEPLTLFEETFGLEGNRAGSHPQHLIELMEPGLVGGVARALSGAGSRLSVRVASPRTSTCAEARSAGLEALWIVPEADERVRERARDEGFAAVGARAGWRRGETWSCERWALDVDGPEELLRAVQARVNGITTTEPRRALSIRALDRMAAPGLERYPVQVPPLEVEPGTLLPADGSHPSLGAPGGTQWSGRWKLEVEVENPFPFEVRVAAELAVRRGAFEAEGLPAAARLLPGQTVRFPLRLVGGSWRMGGDPLVLVHYTWGRGPGRPEELLTLEAPLERRRTLRLGEASLRIELVRERPGDEPVSMTLKRSGRDLVAAIENPGRLEAPRILVHLDGVVHTGGRGLRLRLPEDFPVRKDGVPFSAGISGRRADPRGAGGRGASDRPTGGERVVRRWAGGLPDRLDGGSPGRLLPDASG